jgi:hypothetical protein
MQVLNGEITPDNDRVPDNLGCTAFTAADAKNSNRALAPKLTISQTLSDDKTSFRRIENPAPELSAREPNPSIVRS